VGKRYTREEINQIQALYNEGSTDRDIAARLGRSEPGIRNIRHRMKIKSDTKDPLKALQRNRAILNKQVSELKRELRTLQARKEDVSKAL